MTERTRLSLCLCAQRHHLEPAAEAHRQRRRGLVTFRLLGGHQRGDGRRGSICDDIANTDQGSAYVFVRSGTTWSQQQKLTAGDGATDDLFGLSVAISGETVVVGAHRDDIGANSDQGSAYVFVRSGTTWSQQQKLTASDGAADDVFGYRWPSAGIPSSWERPMTTSAPTSIKARPMSLCAAARPGASSRSSRPATARLMTVRRLGRHQRGDTRGGSIVTTLVESGSAYVFVRSGTTWSQQQKLTASDGAAVTGSAPRWPSAGRRSSWEHILTTLAPTAIKARPTSSSQRHLGTAAEADRS